MIELDNDENTMGQCFTSLRHHLGRVRDRVSHWTSNSETLSAMRTRWHQRTEWQPELRRRIAELELELTTQREEVTRLTEQLNNRDSQRDRLSTERQLESRRRIAELELELTTQREEVTRLTEQLNNRDSQRDRLSTERQLESRRRIAELELELTTQREEVTRLTGQLNNRDSQRDRLSTRVIELENEVITLRSLAEQRNNLQTERDRDWAITENEIQIKRDQELGRGAWGIVYRGEFHGCDVAVKEMHPIIISDRNRQLFEREVDIASRCRHPCLLQFIGATTGERPLLVTEIMVCSLREQLPYIPSAPRLSDQNIIIISLDVAKALNYLHQKGNPIIHHDISSSNVLLWRQGDDWRAKVSDYGTANFVRQSNINYAGALIYCAPESRDPGPQTSISLKVSSSTCNVGCLPVT